VLSVQGGGTGARYSLKPNHWRLARRYLCFDTKVPVGSLAAFLYRDFAVEAKSPTISDIVSIFRTEFGYPSQSTLVVMLSFGTSTKKTILPKVSVNPLTISSDTER